MTCITFIPGLQLLSLAVEIFGRRVKDTTVAAGVSSVIGVRFLGLSGLVVADVDDQTFWNSRSSLRQIKNVAYPLVSLGEKSALCLSAPCAVCHYEVWKKNWEIWEPLAGAESFWKIRPSPSRSRHTDVKLWIGKTVFIWLKGCINTLLLCFCSASFLKEVYLVTVLSFGLWKLCFSLALNVEFFFLISVVIWLCILVKWLNIYVEKSWDLRCDILGDSRNNSNEFEQIDWQANW